MVTELQILFNQFALYSYDFSQFEYFYKVQRYPRHHLKHKICQFFLVPFDLYEEKMKYVWQCYKL